MMARREGSLDDVEDVPFLEDDLTQGRSKETQTSKTSRRYRRRWMSPTYIMIFNLLFLIINFSWTVVNFIMQQRPSAAYRPIITQYEPEGAPAQLEPTTWQLSVGVRSAFTHFDPKVADPAWKSITVSGQGFMKVSEAKMREMNETSVPVADGSGEDLFALDVFHNLHCLDYIRKRTIMYRPMYPPVEEDIPEAYHLPHCIDSIRLSLQCHADLTLIPHRWADGWLQPWPVWTNKHECRNFDAIRSWAREVQPHMKGLLVHPQLGEVVSGPMNKSALPIWQEEHDNIPDTGYYGDLTDFS
ncbi:hypothetical protein F5Y16DRAFT_358292 [Xylariaceae sp. FL0255]|nr:hypothetical protein F5Y16DRAFT_358292 [Xylariaceae sp. FL0255]